jgi:hypothetical protein
LLAFYDHTLTEETDLKLVEMVSYGWSPTRFAHSLLYFLRSFSDSAQLSLPAVQKYSTGGRVVGVIVGVLLGMTTLLFRSPDADAAEAETPGGSKGDGDVAAANERAAAAEARAAKAEAQLAELTRGAAGR